MTYKENKDKSLDKFSHSLGQNWYHIVLVPKKRYAVFQWPQIKQSAEEAFELVCSRHNISIFTKEIMDNHVHLFVNCPPDFSIRKLLQILKGGTSFYIREKHPSLKKYKSFWNKGGMYRSLGSISASVVQKYIERQDWH
jgi:putative transposase